MGSQKVSESTGNSSNFDGSSWDSLLNPEGRQLSESIHEDILYLNFSIDWFNANHGIHTSNYSMGPLVIEIVNLPPSLDLSNRSSHVRHHSWTRRAKGSYDLEIHFAIVLGAAARLGTSNPTADSSKTTRSFGAIGTLRYHMR